MAMLIRAGLEGLRANLPAPPLFSGDPALISETEHFPWLEQAARHLGGGTIGTFG